MNIIMIKNSNAEKMKEKTEKKPAKYIKDPKAKAYITKIFDYLYKIWHLKWTISILSEELSCFDCIHFHFLFHVRQFTNTFPRYKGLKILTTHSPCPWTDEIIDTDKSLRILRPFLIRQECKSFKNADFIMFPCLQAKEPYYHNRRIRKTLIEMEDKTFYVPTSLITLSLENTQIPNRKQYNIPDSAIVAGFFGRHNHIKGYDILKDIAVTALDNCPNLYFLIAGSGNIQPIDHPRWIELGYISNVKETMEICDLYLLPNRETYFDIVMLEALRAGLITLISDTGGNKFFKTLPSTQTDGIYYFDINNKESAIGHLEDLHTLKETNPAIFAKMKDNNRTLFEHYFTIKTYVENYTKEINKIAFTS